MGDDKRRELSRAREILARARALPGDADLGALAVELATVLIEAASSLATRAERKRGRLLSARLAARRSQAFVTALTDRIHRTRDSARVVTAALDCIERLQPAEEMPRWDRAQLVALERLGPLFPELAASALRRRVEEEARPYLIDARPEALGRRLAERRAQGARVNLNYLGEETLGEAEAARQLESYLALVERDDVDALSVKLSSVESQVSVLAFEDTVQRAVHKLKPVLLAASRRSRPRLVYFDMEAYKDFELTLEIFFRLLEDPALLSARAGIAIQAYLPESSRAVERLAEFARARVDRGGAPLRLRLVKGANLAMERVEASLHRWEVPVFPSKEEVDAHFKRVLRRALAPSAAGSLVVGVASHNSFDVAYALVLAAARGLEDWVQIEMLEGMAEPFARAVSEVSGGLLLYAPAVLPENFPVAISYLVRRLDESSATENFLPHSFSLQIGDEEFVRQREKFERALRLSSSPAPATRRLQNRVTGELGLPQERRGQGGFDNAPDTDFTSAVNRAWLAEHLVRRAQEVSSVRPRIGGRDVSGEVTSGFDPSRPGVVPYFIELASEADVERALVTLEESRALWGAEPAARRVQIVRQVADVLERHRGELIAALVLDAGKRVLEADVEVSEAVDFARYYALSYEGLEADFELTPLGSVVVTPPWNFPLAIPLGGCLAALVAGNTVILKPAPETPLVARLLAEACWEAGVPTEALQFVPVADEDASPLVTDPRVDAVILTGATSTAERFLAMRPGLRLFAETGGKNAAFLSALADRPQAISQIVQSAFGHAGQKCSALSVLVVHREVFEDESFQRELVDATRSLRVGSAWELSSFVTPLIHPPRGPLARVLEELEPGESWLVRPAIDPENPRSLSPGILWNARPGGLAHLAEFFGPVLAVLPASDQAEALELMNATDYGLTAGLFSLDERERARFFAEMDAGNLYVNRPVTGAIVGRQPFGGRKASGFGPGAKAGGPYYVAQFCQLRGRRRVDAPRPSSAREEESRRALGARVAPFVEGWLASLSLEDGSTLRARLVDYEAAAAEFSRPVLGTEAWGEENLLVHQPARVVLVRGAGASQLDWISARAAACYAGASLDAREGGDAELAPLRAALERWPHARVRVVGALSPEHERFFAERPRTYVERAPVHSAGFEEVRRYLLEQSRSTVLHRYGNLPLEVTRK